MVQSIQLQKLEHEKDTYIVWLVISSVSKDDFSIQNEMDIGQGMCMYKVTKTNI